jgi:hypothetical protein
MVDKRPHIHSGARRRRIPLASGNARHDGFSHRDRGGQVAKRLLRRKRTVTTHADSLARPGCRGATTARPMITEF